jgi:DNA-binding MarR family transcriptional regulator
VADESLNRIEHAIVTLVRRNTDPRGYRNIQRRAQSDLERASAVMLWRLGDHEPARLSTLAEAAGVEISTASRQVAGLVERGYVERRPDPDDGRATVHRLTDAGRELRERIVLARHEWIETLLEGFSDDEREAFADLLERFVAAMSQP